MKQIIGAAMIVAFLLAEFAAIFYMSGWKTGVTVLLITAAIGGYWALAHWLISGAHPEIANGDSAQSGHEQDSGCHQKGISEP